MTPEWPRCGRASKQRLRHWAPRQAIREAIRTRGPVYLERLGDPAQKDHWKPLQNHFWVKASGLYLAALAIQDEVPEVKPWLRVIDGRFDETWKALGPDGASHEGVGYWQYGLNAMVRYLWVRRQITGIDGFKHPWFSNTAFYGIAMTTPKSGWVDPTVDSTRADRVRMNVDFSDCPRYHWYGPDYLYRFLAREYGIPQAQWMADAISADSLGSPVEPWLNLLFQGAGPISAPLDTLPTLFHFSDMGIVSARSGWGNGAALLAVHCGAALGRKSTSRPSPHEHFIPENVGHVHPDAASFCLFAEGEWQVPNAGYIQRRTKFENTLILNGKGQLDQDDKMGWFDPASEFGKPALLGIPLAESTTNLDHILADARPLYPGLKCFKRHFLFAKPDLLVVLDELESETSASFDLLFHFERADDRVTSDGGPSWLQAGDRSVLRLSAFPSGGTTCTLENQALNARHGPGVKSRATLHVKHRTDRWMNAVAYTWAAPGRTPAMVSLKQSGDEWQFSIPFKKITWHEGSGIASVAWDNR